MTTMTTDKTGAPTESPPKPTASPSPSTGSRSASPSSSTMTAGASSPHTEVDEEFGGRGLATILVREALDATRAAGLRIVPVCPMVAASSRSTPSSPTLVDPVTTDVKRRAGPTLGYRMRCRAEFRQVTGAHHRVGATEVVASALRRRAAGR